MRDERRGRELVPIVFRVGSVGVWVVPTSGESSEMREEEETIVGVRCRAGD